MPRDLFACIAIEVNGKIYVAGGFDGAYTDIDPYGTEYHSGAIYLFDPNVDVGGEWQELTYVHGDFKKILLAKSGKILYVITDGSTIEAYDTEMEIWIHEKVTSLII